MLIAHSLYRAALQPHTMNSCMEYMHAVRIVEEQDAAGLKAHILHPQKNTINNRQSTPGPTQPLNLHHRGPGMACCRVLAMPEACKLAQLLSACCPLFLSDTCIAACQALTPQPLIGHKYVRTTPTKAKLCIMCPQRMHHGCQPTRPTPQKLDSPALCCARCRMNWVTSTKRLVQFSRHAVSLEER